MERTFVRACTATASKEGAERLERCGEERERQLRRTQCPLLTTLMSLMTIMSTMMSTIRLKTPTRIIQPVMALVINNFSTHENL